MAGMYPCAENEQVNKKTVSAWYAWSVEVMNVGREGEG